MIVSLLAPLLASLSFNCGFVPATPLWASIGGEYQWHTQTVTVTPNTCAVALRLRNGYTWQRGYAAFTIAHELGHASGLYGEPEADCYGAGHVSAVAYLLGLRGSYARLLRDGQRYWGYAPIPATCFA